MLDQVQTLRPEPVTHTRPESSGAAGTLIGGGLCDAYRYKSRQPAIRIEARHTRPAGIDHHTHAFDGQAGLGDGGGQDNLAAAVGIGRDGAVLLRLRQIAIERAEQYARTHRIGVQQRQTAADFSGTGQEGQHIAVLLLHCRADRHGHVARNVALVGRGAVQDLDRIAATLAAQHRRTEQLRDSTGIQRRRHHQQAQILAQSALRVQAQGQTQIGIEMALVEFIEDYQTDAVEAGIALQAARKYRLGHNLDARARADLGLETDTIADGFTDLFTEQSSHEHGCGPRRQTARLEHDDAPSRQPRRIEQRQWHTRGLACTGRRLQDQRRVLRQGLAQRCEDDIDGQG